MKPLKLVLIHRGNWYRDKLRIDGQFAYEVPGLEWRHFPVDKSFEVDLSVMKDIDVVWLDDGKYGQITMHPLRKNRISPTVHYVLYPTLAEHIRQSRIERAEKDADLVLLDHDKLKNWEGYSFQVRRLAYSVNDWHYRDRGLDRDIDVGFYCVWGYNPLRPQFEKWLSEYCKKQGWVFWGLGGQGIGTSYAELLARTKVVVHLNRTPETRAPRAFDVAACGAALLSNPIPEVSGEYWEEGRHYIGFSEPVDWYTEKRGVECHPLDDCECREVISGLDLLLKSGNWRQVAQDAKTMVLANHTWARRAVELRGILLDCFPELRKKLGEDWRYRP